MSKEPMPITLTVNSEESDVDAWPTDTLADILREKPGLTDTKTMCNEGECGSCTILIDGNPVPSCLTLAIECEEKDILTIDGLADSETGEMHPVQKAFVERSGMQCGLCTPGMLLTAKSSFDENNNACKISIPRELVKRVLRALK